MSQFELDNKEATVSILFMYVYTTFDSFDNTNSVTLYICLNIFLFFLTPLTYIFHSNLQCSMQHAACTFDPVDIPWILQEGAFRIPVFGGKISLIYLIIYQLSCQRVLANLTQLSLWSLLTIPWMTQLSSFNQFGAKNEQIFQITSKFHRVKTCFCLLSTPSTLIQITHKFTFRSDHA